MVKICTRFNPKVVIIFTRSLESGVYYRENIMEELLRRLHPVSLPRIVKRGSNILFQGEIPRKAYIIRDGVVRAYTITSSGEERIVAFYSKGDILPLSWLLGETTNALFYYDALTDVRLMAVEKDEFLQNVMDDKVILASLLKFINTQSTALLLRITGLEQSRAIEKIGFTLYYLLFRYGVEKTPGCFAVNIKMSQLVVANLVGLTRESTTKNLKILKDKGVIDYDHSSYTINKAKLEGFLGEDSFRDLKLLTR